MVNVVVVFLLDRHRIPLVPYGNGLLVIVKLLAWSGRFDPADPLGRDEVSFGILDCLENHDQPLLDLGPVGRHNRPSGINDS